MRIQFGLLFVVCLCGRAVFAQVGPQQLIGRAVEDVSAEKYKSINEAIDLFFRGDAAGAGQLLDNAKKANAELPPGSVMLAQLYFSSNQVNRVRQELENAVTSDPGDPEAYLLFGDLALRDGRMTDAEALFLRGMGMCQRLTNNQFRQRELMVSGYSGLVAIASQRNQWAVVERNARAWVEIDGDSVPARSQLGRALFFLQKPRSALEEFQTLHKADATTPLPEISMALLYEELVAQGDETKRASARNAMKRAEEVDGDNAFTRLAIARWAIDVCDLEMAERNAKAVLEKDDASIDARLLLAVVATHRGQWAEAETTLRALHVVAPTNFEITSHLTIALAEQKEPAKLQLALSYAELNLRANPDVSLPASREASAILAWTLFKLGQQADAISTAQSAIRAGSLSDTGTYFVARIFADAGQAEFASRLLGPVIASKRCFAHRKVAESLQEKLKQ